MKEKSYLDYQEGTISSIIANPNDADKVISIVTENDFADERYKLIFNSIKDIRKDKEDISLLGVLSNVIENHPEANIDPEWVMSLDKKASKWSLEAPPITWAQLLKREAAKFYTRKLLSETERRLESDNPIDIANYLKASADEISQNAAISTLKTTDDMIEGYLEHMDSRLNEKKYIIPSPYPSIDKYITGYLPQQLITVGARTSVGKSVVAMQSAVTACMAGKSVAIFSLEMSEYEVMDRMISNMSMIEMGRLKGSQLGAEERKDLNEALEHFRNFKIHIDDRASVTIEYIRQQAIRLAQSDSGLDFIIIDYLQLMETDKNIRSRQEAVSNLSKEMKRLAKDLNIPIMILVQVNRERNDDENPIPKLNDIRESGGIAMDSDVVILLHRDIDSDDIDPKALFIIAKNRGGETGRKMYMRCQLEYAMFLDTNEEANFNNIEDEEYLEEMANTITSKDIDINEAFSESFEINDPGANFKESAFFDIEEGEF